MSLIGSDRLQTVEFLGPMLFQTSAARLESDHPYKK
jgi:hypothetical protein